jgi:hypothetical protein
MELGLGNGDCSGLEPLTIRLGVASAGVRNSAFRIPRSLFLKIEG